jgi:hypothetical protein
MFLTIKEKIFSRKTLEVLIACLIFLVVTILASYKVLPSSGIITYGDTPYFHNIVSQWRNIATTWTPNYLGQNQSSSIWNYLPNVLIIFLLKIFSLSNNAIAYLMSFGLFFLTAIVYYFVFYKISKNFYFGILAGLFVVLNNLTIEYIAYGGFLYYFLGLISFALLFNLLWEVNANKGELSKKSIFFIILFSLLSLHPFFFVIYLISIFLFFLFYIWQYHKFNDIWKYLITFLGVVLASSYWVFPFIYNSLSTQPGNVYGAANLNNVFLGFLKVASYISAIDFFQYFGFFSRDFHQTIFHYIFYIGIVFLLLLSGLSIKNNKNKYFLLFLLFFYILFFNFALGPVSRIFGSTWMWLWNNISLFSFFRSFSRFLAIIIPIYLFYFAVYNLEWRYKYKNYIYIIFCVFVICLNLKVLTGNLGGNILATKIPKEYEKVNYDISGDKSEDNIVSLPSASYEAYDWGMNNDTTLLQQNYFLKDYLFVKPIIYDRTSLGLASLNQTFANVFSNNKLNNLSASLDNLNDGYVLVQKDLVDIFTLKNVEYGEYENYFDNNPDYTLMENNDYFDLYKNNIKTTELLADNSFFKRINSTEYKVYLENLTTAQALILFQNYNSNWSLFINKNNASNDSCAMVNEYNDGNIKTTECAPEQRFFDGEEFSYLYQKPIFDNTHQLVDDYANGWTIDPNYIKQNFDPSYYKVNPDGSIDIELTIYFKPQSYFDLGLIVSGATVLACFGYLGWDFARRRKEKMTATTTIKKEEDV